MTDQDTQIRALASMTGQQGPMPQTRAEKDVLMAGMIAMALGRKMTWAQIGSALGWGHLLAQGDIVLYCLDETDAAGITSRRNNFQKFNQGRSGHKHPHPPDIGRASGHVAHIGTPVHTGQEFAAQVCAVPDAPRLNLRVLLDGSDVHWVTNVPQGSGEPGTWRQRE